MATTVGSVSPADGEAFVWRDRPAVVEILDAAEIDPGLVEVVVNGVSCTVANGGLGYWNTAKYSGGVIVETYEDVFFATLLPWWEYGSAEVTLAVNYDSVEISSTTFETAADERYNSQAACSWMALALGGIYDGPMSALAHYFVSTIEPWLFRVEAHYHVQTTPPISFDARYWVAHWAIFDGAAALAVGEPAINDGAAALAVQAYARTDGAAALAVQGYVRTDGAAALAVGNPSRSDGAAGVAVGIPARNDGAGALAVFEVNRRTTVEVKSVSAETKAAMDELELEPGEE